MKKGLSTVGAKRNGFVSRADMHTPIALVRSSRVPVESQVSFEHRLTAYYKGLSKFTSGKRKPLDGQDLDTSVRFFFVVDYVGLSVEARDYVVKGNTLYQILSVLPHEERGITRFLTLETTEINKLNESIVIDTEELFNQEVELSNPFWTNTHTFESIPYPESYGFGGNGPPTINGDSLSNLF